MEILIVGSIIVALMVYTSTKIKRRAAQAFEEETVETEDFFLVKPEGFLNPIRDESQFAFVAYSKDYGEEDAEKLRQALITLNVLTGKRFAEVCKDAKQSVDKVLAEEKIGRGIFLLKGEKAEKSVGTEIYHKIIEDEQKVYDLQVTVLGESQKVYEERVNKLIESFRVK
ncbi:MAG: hypothetical protein ABJA66_10880 [Actinomycetota bacterium]